MKIEARPGSRPTPPRASLGDRAWRFVWASPGKQSGTGKQPGNDHGLRWQYVATRGNPGDASPQLDDLVDSRTHGAGNTEAISMNFRVNFKEARP